MSVELVASLQARIAVLELEVSYARREAETSANGARFLLELETSNALRDSIKKDKLMEEMSLLRSENQRLYIQNENYALRLDQTALGTTKTELHRAWSGTTHGCSVSHVSAKDLGADLIDLHESEPGAPRFLSGTGIGRNGSPDRAKPADLHAHIDDIIASPTSKDIKHASTTVFEQEPEVSLSFSSMIEGTSEWEDTNRSSDVTSALPNTPLSPPEAATPRGARSFDRFGPLESFTGRPDYARDEKWIRWTPTAPKLCRSNRVIISNLPDNTTYHQLLARVCGGIIVSCQLLDTSKLCGSATALVRFLHINAAEAFYAYAKGHPIILQDTFYGSMTARVSLPATPSFPLRIQSYEAILKHGHTRCLELHGVPLTARVDNEDCLASPHGFLQSCAFADPSTVEHTEMKDNSLYIAFTSVTAAESALDKLHGNSMYRGCTAWFAPDPCDRPLPKSEERETATGLALGSSFGSGLTTPRTLDSD